MRRVAPSLLVAIALSSIAAPAAANGVFPSADQLVVDPSDPGRLVVRTTYGLLSTSDGGATWDWICEPAVGYAGGGTWHPPIAAASGGVLAALLDGLAAGAGGGCTWTRAADLEGRFMIDVSVERGNPAAAVAVADGDNNTLWESGDGGSSWIQAGVNLEKGLRTRTVDVAPSDPQRVYVSGLMGDPGVETGWISRSPDRGQTWELVSIPGSDAEHAPYIGGVDPNDPGVLYVRLSGTPGRLLATANGGDTWTTVFQSAGFVRAFAISPDGSTVIVGGDVDGVWRAPSGTLVFEKVSAVAPRCFAWAAAGLYACATEFVDGFTIGISTNGGETFEPLLRQPCIRGPLPCAPGTPVADQCPLLWPQVAMLTGHTECGPDAGAPDGGPDGGPGAGGGAGGPPGPGGGSAATSAPPAAGDCGCGIEGPVEGAGVAAIAAALALIRRRRSRSKKAR